MPYTPATYPVLDSPVHLADSIYKMTLARQAKAKAAEQEALNPNVARMQMADILAKEIANKYMPREKEAAILGQELSNKWYGPNMQSQISYRDAQRGLTNEQIQEAAYNRTHGGYQAAIDQKIAIGS